MMRKDHKKSIAEKLAEKFMTWQFPPDLSPDGGLSYTPSIPHPDDLPTGTNLMTQQEAICMFEDLLEGVLPSSELVFSDTAEDMEKRQAEYENLDCPCCGGSGHADDAMLSGRTLVNADLLIQSLEGTEQEQAKARNQLRELIGQKGINDE